MRKLLIPLLLASAAAATPALADPGDGDRHYSGDRQTRSESRSERRQSSEPRRSERSVEVNNNSNNDSPQVRSFGGDRPHVSSSDSADSVRSWRGAERREGRGGPALVDSTERSHPGPGMRAVQDGPSDAGSRSGRRIRVVENDGDGGGAGSTADRRTFWRQRIKEVESSGGTASGPLGGSGGLVQPERTLPRVLRTRVPVVSDTPREGTQPPLRTETRRTTSHHRWTGDWRRDHRYDWWNWRRRHRSHFHLGFYFDPFGWNYRRYDIGWRLWPAYYSSRFWIDDPWSYRLPYAPPGYRWIRYYDDLILVDTWDGRVVDVIYNFFW